MELQFPLSLPETMGGKLTNRKKGSVCLWVTGYVPIPTSLPTSRNVRQTNRIIYGRCGTWCTINTPKEWTCLCYFSIIYGSIKHFIIIIIIKH